MTTPVIPKPPGHRTRFTAKQMIVVTAIHQKNPDGSFLDIDQLMEALPYEVTKQALHFCLRALVRHGLIEKAPREPRRNHFRAIYKMTEAGEIYMRTSMEPEKKGEESMVESPETALLEDMASLFR